MSVTGFPRLWTAKIYLFIFAYFILSKMTVLTLAANLIIEIMEFYFEYENSEKDDGA